LNVVSRETRSMSSAPLNARIDQRTENIATRGRDPRRPQPLIDALIPDAHLNAAVAGIRGLGLGGLRVMALGPSWTSPGLWSRHTAARAVGPSVVGAPGELERRIARLASDHGPLVVYPSREETIDLMLSARDWDGVVLPFPGSDVLQEVRDKSRLEQTAANAGLKTPTALFEGSADELTNPATTRGFRWPVVVKPAQPVSALKTARLAADAEELQRLLRRVPAEERLLVQERVRGPLVSIELVIDREGRLVARFQQVTKRTWPSAAGSIALATSVEPDEGLVAGTAAMLAELGYWGLAQVDFVDTPDGFTLLDVNPRFYRCLPLAVACGTNLPALWHAVAVGRPVGMPGTYRTGMTYRWLEADFVAAARGAPGLLFERAPAPSTGAAWAAGDPLPGLLLSLSAVVSRVLRVLRVRRRTG
jgi:predicted ATP-grasp superfamily ATP-dependent carboligase